MRLTPPRAAEIVTAAFGALLLLSLFLPWYRGRAGEITTCRVGDPCGQGEASVSGFTALSVLDVYLVIIAAAALALLVLDTTQRTPAVAVAWAAVVTPLAAVATGLVVWRVLDPPAGAGTEPIFAYLALVAAAGLTVGCVRSMRDQSQRSTPYGAGGRGAKPDPLPAPPPGGAHGGPER